MSTDSPPFVAKVIGTEAGDAHFDLIDALGGDSVVEAFYVTKHGETGEADGSVQHSAGVVNEWWDYRGESSHGPKLVASGTARPGWDGVALEIEADGVDDWMGTATSPKFTLDVARSLIVVATFEGANDTQVAALTTGASLFNPMLALHRHVTNGNIASQYYPDNGRIDSGIAGGATVRVALASKNGTTTGAIEVPDDAQVTGAISAGGGGNNKLVLFTYTDPGVSFSAAKVRAVIVLAGAYNATQRDLIKAWAVANLGAVLI